MIYNSDFMKGMREGSELASLRHRVAELEAQVRALQAVQPRVRLLAGDPTQYSDYHWIESGKNADLIFPTSAQRDEAEERRRSALEILRFIARRNAEQGWEPVWDGKHKNWAFKVNRSEGRVNLDSGSYYVATQSLPDCHYMSEDTLQRVTAHFTDDQLIEFVQYGHLGVDL